MQDQLVERRQIGRIETHRVLDEQDGLHAPCEDVLLGVHRILDEFDDADHQIGIAAPREDVVDARSVALVDTAVDVLREGGEQRHGNLRMALLDDLGEREDVQFPHVVHRQDEVERIVASEQVQRLARRADARERRRVRHVQVEVLLIDLRLDMSVFFENVPVVAAADQQDFVDAVFHEAVGEFAPVGHVLFQAFVHSDAKFVLPTKIRKKLLPLKSETLKITARQNEQGEIYPAGGHHSRPGARVAGLSETNL